ncbi:MAG: glycoside hydrolase family 13 protein [Clostridia bacterium]|nr:glycoside hydrolase family 13 protein [Clostridia bacterium]MBR1686647.1 glycoside hydrolase family 13 protein [Clostridia bacterium]
MIHHDSHAALYREPMGPAAAGSEIVIRLKSDTAKKVVLRTWMGDDVFWPMKKHGDMWSATVKVPETTGLLWYDFTVTGKDGKSVYYGAPDDGLGGEGRVYAEGLHSWQLTVFSKTYHTPAFMHGATMYQIFPDRFLKAPTESVDTRTNRKYQSWDEDLMIKPDPACLDNCVNNFYGGTLNGIREKLPYLHDLGVEILYLNPIFEAYSNHRYDTGDYTKIDPLLGTNEEFQALCEEAGKLGMHIMLDGVFSHTGEDSIYFNDYNHYPEKGAYQSKESRYYDWYTFEHYPDKYRCWWGFKNLPEVRKDNREYQHFMFNDENGIVPSWIRSGACGWRLDVADELSMDFLRKLRHAVKKEKRDAVVLGEVWEDASSKIAYGEMRCYCTGDTLDSVMNYPLRTAILDFMTGKTDADALVRLIRHQAEVYPVPFLYSLMNLMGSHDRTRALNALIGKEGEGMTKAEQRAMRMTPAEYALATRRYRSSLDILCALPGCPTVYYGDEAGMTGTADPFCRRPYPWGKEDTALQDYVRAKLNHRKHSHVLRYGKCEVSVVDKDTLRIRRYFDGTDAFGHKAAPHTEEIFTISR